MRKHDSRPARALALGAILTGLVAASASAATTSVDVNDGKFFSPGNVTQSVGGSVHWQASGIDSHSVTQDGMVFDTGAAAPGVDFTRTFSAGTFPYHCREHSDDGMVGRVTVPPKVLATPTGLPFTVQWATAASNTGNRFDVQYRIGAGTWRTWLRGSSARSKVFGARSAPTRVRRGTTYSFRVISSSGATARSGLSPVVRFRAN